MTFESTHSALTHSARGSLRQKKAEPQVRVIVFSIGELTLALHIEVVYKIISNTLVFGSGLSNVGIAHLGEHELTILDLQQNLYQNRTPGQAVTADYVIVIQSSNGEFYGIPVSVAPTIMELPISTIRVLPESYRNADTLGIATHTAVIEAEKPLTLFLLDVYQLLHKLMPQ
ncbi:chemotaxis protein CheW [Leptolyngbya sp. FACHB-261]|uniref:chemotaxis protein CheW n=1 Tax=Leptolyngbya sp. FACHB-261 TaxID=2692806 RepID=UPI0016825603|nr:chemotaxis protein CheW [Leptolyngbya sp. FACHB-261]MBD2102873.1 chemotaxis protein CheW [Leptolyngbya sp. FACHB-261]